MAKIELRTADVWIKQLEKLNANRDETLGRAIYAGAAIVADEIRREINALPVQNGVHGSEDRLIDSVTSVQKKGLLDGFGVSKLKNENGFLNVKLGFDGYNATRTKKYPRGQPNAMIARSINSGTTFRAKRPFVRNAVRATQNRAVEKMESVLDVEIKKIMK